MDGHLTCYLARAARPAGPRLAARQAKRTNQEALRRKAERGPFRCPCPCHGPGQSVTVSHAWTRTDQPVRRGTNVHRHGMSRRTGRRVGARLSGTFVLSGSSSLSIDSPCGRSAAYLYITALDGERSLLPRTGPSVPSESEPYRVSVSFGRITQNSFPRGRPVPSRTLRQSARCRPGAPPAREAAQSPVRGPARY